MIISVIIITLMWQSFGISIKKNLSLRILYCAKEISEEGTAVNGFSFRKRTTLHDLSHASLPIQFLTTSSLEARPGWEREVAPISGKTAFIVVHNAAESVPPLGPLYHCLRFEKPAFSLNVTSPPPSSRDNSERVFSLVKANVSSALLF